MRRRTVALTILSLAVGSQTPASAGTDPELAGHPDTCDGAGIAHHVVRAKSLTRRSFDENRWEDATPVKASEKRKRTDHKLCVERKGKRKLIARFVDEKADQFQEYRQQQLALAAIDPPGAAYLAGLRACESGGDYTANTGNGFYGAYQFVPSTWYSVGGTGMPHLASPAEQDYRAALLWRQQGSSPWPVCG